jgi:uncharacterized protein (DUF433 family)
MTTITTVIKPETTLRSRYVTTDPAILQGEPIIEGTIVAVRDIVQLWNAGIQPKAMLPELFHQVTIAQIFDALSLPKPTSQRHRKNQCDRNAIRCPHH